MSGRDDAQIARPLSRGNKWVTTLLVIALCYGGFLRLWRPFASSPGLQLDEASNAWNAWCLLKTGTDEWGERWPIFRERALDDYRSPLYLYLLLPFQAIWGMNVATTRMPAAIGGIVTIWLTFYIGRRLFDEKIGLAAAIFLALCPWHIQDTRWGHEGCITPLLAAVALASLFWAGAPFLDDRDQVTPKRTALKAFVAGVLIGVACYGYAAIRLYIAVSLAALACVNLPGLIRASRLRQPRRALLALAAGLLISAGPLVCKHLTDPLMNRRADATRSWPEDATLPQRIEAIAARYPAHFGPSFLFLRGQLLTPLCPPDGYGEFEWYGLPLFLAGAAWTIAHLKSPSARSLAALVVTYPAGDLIFGVGEPHSLRSFAGIIALSMLAGVGAVEAARFLLGRWRPVAVGACAGFLVWVVSAHFAFATYFFGDFNNDPKKIWARHVNLMTACEWLKPRLADRDVVIVSRSYQIVPHVTTLVFLDYDPNRWFAEPKEYSDVSVLGGTYHFCTAAGKLRFRYEAQDIYRDLQALKANGRVDRVVLFLSQEEAPLVQGHAPELIIGGPKDFKLYVFDIEI